MEVEKCGNFPEKYEIFWTHNSDKPFPFLMIGKSLVLYEQWTLCGYYFENVVDNCFMCVCGFSLCALLRSRIWASVHTTLCLKCAYSITTLSLAIITRMKTVSSSVECKYCYTSTVLSHDAECCLFISVWSCTHIRCVFDVSVLWRTFGSRNVEHLLDMKRNNTIINYVGWRRSFQLM